MVLDVEEDVLSFVGTVLGGVGGNVKLVSVTGAEVGRVWLVEELDVEELEVFFGGNDKCFVASAALFDEFVEDKVFVRSGRSGGGLLATSLISLNNFTTELMFFNIS